jgi:ubiquinone/menaquinone biosynthesis C-methylase UbiE
MAKDERYRVCPAENAGALDIKLRRLLHNPQKILKPYIQKGMKVLDLGCGPGFFTIDMAMLTGSRGKVVGADLQDGMLEILRGKINKLNFQNIITLHKCGIKKINLSDKFDFILIFYMLHEVPDKDEFLNEIKSMLEPDGKVLISEPKFHVSKNDFKVSIGKMRKSGFDIAAEPDIFFSRSVVLINKS